VRATSEAERLEAIYSADWLTPKECGRIAGNVGADNIIAAIDGGELKALEVHSPDAQRRRFKVRRDWLEEWVDARTVNG